LVQEVLKFVKNTEVRSITPNKQAQNGHSVGYIRKLHRQRSITEITVIYPPVSTVIHRAANP